MVMPSNKTTITIIIVVLFPLLVLLPWVLLPFPEKCSIENEISTKCSSISDFIRQQVGGFIYRFICKISQLELRQNSDN